MSLEFAVQYPCSLRARYSESHLREWGRLSSLHARLTTGDMGAPSTEKLEWVENARDEVELMQAETAVCSGCPANLLATADGIPAEGEAVGCLGRINYPIEASFETVKAVPAAVNAFAWLRYATFESVPDVLMSTPFNSSAPDAFTIGLSADVPNRPVPSMFSEPVCGTPGVAA